MRKDRWTVITRLIAVSRKIVKAPKNVQPIVPEHYVLRDFQKKGILILYVALIGLSL
jgi:hypothetical protein